MSTKKKLTKAQQAVYDAICNYIGNHGYAPSVRDIRDVLGLYSISTISVHLKHLEEKGYISRKKGTNRSITLVYPESAYNSVHSHEIEACDCECLNDGTRFTVHVIRCSHCLNTYEYIGKPYEYCPHCKSRIVLS
jgi:DNA-binding MarR family transcriptional regulator